MRVEFECFEIETAPKDRYIALWCPNRVQWLKGKWDEQPHNKEPKPYWTTHAYHVTSDRDDQPTYWAELDSLAPTASREENNG